MTTLGTLRLDLDVVESLGKRFQPDAIVVQEDRRLKLGTNYIPNLDPENDHDAAYLAISAQRPLPLGRYLLLRPQHGDHHWIYQAVVHDLVKRPSCRAGDVRRSLTAILADAERRGLRAIASDPLGAYQERGLTWEEVVEAFDATIYEACLELTSSLRMTLLLPHIDDLEEVSHLLRSRVLRRARRSFRTVDGDAAVVEVLQDGVRLHFRFVPGSLSGYIITRVTHDEE